ncbi:MAG: tRNA-specific adenosine deaminase [Proteobacteria bacterium]|nr:tRNA-specific adenosine deaminase [Pseudomonadota bacterium]
MNIAIDLARKAAQLGEVPVAAIITHNDKIIARAHNRRELDKDPTAHAEILAIKEAAKHIGDWRLEHCTIYVTLEPCPMCAGAIFLSRIERCVFGCFDPKAGFNGSLCNINDYEKLNHKYEVTPGVCSEICSQLLKDFFQEIRKKKKDKKRPLSESEQNKG